MINKLDQALQFHQVALSLRAQRQQVLAGNIANADTPNFKARDFDFQSTMQQALSGAIGAAKHGVQVTAVGAPGMARTVASHLHGGTSAAAAANSVNIGIPLQYRSVIQPSLDNNTVDMDLERNQFADNALRYEASVTMISGQIKSLLSAIQG